MRAFSADAEPPLDGEPPPAVADARAAGLTYVSDRDPGFTRRRAGKTFSYFDASDKPVRGWGVLERIRRLAIPPAWTGVWICAAPDGHLQATGRDARGRKQYKYHADFRRTRDAAKFAHLPRFGRALPALRRRVARDMARKGLPREKVIATVVHLLETTLIRVGNEEYAQANNSFGLTTLKNPHAKVNGATVSFRFKGKSGKAWSLGVSDKRAAKVVRACQDLPGQHLFEYLDDGGAERKISSSDVNAYLREVSGSDITAKDFRTWAASVMALAALDGAAPSSLKKVRESGLKTTVADVAERLGNTPAICRKCYIHPGVIDGYLKGKLAKPGKTKPVHNLSRDETRLLGLLARS